MKRFGLACVLVIASISFAGRVAAQTGDPSRLTYMSETYPPWNYEEDGRQKGISVEMLGAIWREMGAPAQQIHFMPWARAYRDVQEKPDTVLFSMARTPVREKMFQWVCSITTARFTLFARADRGVFMRSLDEVSRYAVGVIRDDISEILLRPFQDKARIEAVGDMLLNMKKLDAGRVDMVAYSEEGFPAFLSQNGFDPKNYAPVFLLGEIDVCYAFHKNANKELVARFQKGLDAVAASGLRDAIVGKYR